MPCKVCKDQKEIVRDDIPHVVRRCKSCGREMRIISPGDHGIGIRLEKGDRFVIPPSWLRIHANPLKGSGHLTRSGLEWFAKLIFLSELPREKEKINDALKENDRFCTELLKKSALLAGLDIENQEESQKIYEILKDNQESAEWLTYMFGFFNHLAQEAIEQGDAQKSAWAMAGTERFRAMLVFKRDLEDVIWMGHSAKRLIDILQIWDANKANTDEEFWQIQFKQHAYVFSQVFSVPVVFFQDKAYVGGMSIDRQDARIIDFLFSGDSSSEAILIEIKTPATRLVGSKYRNVYAPSAEISAALVQISDYKVTLLQHLTTISNDFGKKLAAFNPRCLIIAGNGEIQLSDPAKRRSFELFRTELQNVEIITYDELFKKMEVLGALFNLVRKKT